ncbi:hypothetical protein ZHAS_00019256 [Anopheles sinensis]|uniref:Uncharacterized protein n=1 Tax=Anopheles sinensis TaxID=74873 RepID=A0A084WL14_ANOSI|nr:hypothetical protein ZHAS_00019256 [Anopheles sinensis]
MHSSLLNSGDCLKIASKALVQFNSQWSGVLLSLGVPKNYKKSPIERVCILLSLACGGSCTCVGWQVI